MMSVDYRSATLERFRQQRMTWSNNAALRALYTYWYGEVRNALKPVLNGAVVEIGSGAGFSKSFIPTIRTSDTVKASWHDCEIDATTPWPFADGELDGILVFDVLHHLAAPGNFFRESERTLRNGGLLVMMEPYVSPCSYPVYRFLHEEGLDTSVAPFGSTAEEDKDPFAGNQALPGLIFGRFRRQFGDEFPFLKVVSRQLYSGVSYIASGGFGRPCPVPYPLWRWLLWVDRHVPPRLRWFSAFRMLIVIERAPSQGRL